MNPRSLSHALHLQTGSAQPSGKKIITIREDKERERGREAEREREKKRDRKKEREREPESQRERETERKERDLGFIPEW